MLKCCPWEYKATSIRHKHITRASIRLKSTAITTPDVSTPDTNDTVHEVSPSFKDQHPPPPHPLDHDNSVEPQNFRLTVNTDEPLIPNDVKDYLVLLTSKHENPTMLLLKKCIWNNRNNAAALTALFDASLEFEYQYPEFRGLIVTRDIIFYVLQSYVRMQRLDLADNVLQRALLLDHIHLHEKALGIMLQAHAKQSAPETLERVEAIFGVIKRPNTVMYNTLITKYSHAPTVTSASVNMALTLIHQMKTDFESGRNRSCEPDTLTYNILLNMLRKSDRHDKIEQGEQIFRSMKRPDTLSYTTLLNLYAQGGMALQAVAMVERMENDYFISKTNPHCQPNAHTYNTLLNALNRSDLSDAMERAELVFASKIAQPNLIAYSTLLDVYAKRGKVDKALALVEQMKTEYASGRNTTCRPTTRTYTILLNTMQYSTRTFAVEQAEKIFAGIDEPSLVTYHTMLNVYAVHKRGADAVDLARRMRAEYEKYNNSACRPSVYTETILAKAIKNSDMKEEDASDVLEWVRSHIKK
jgi:pentatricopeptide repeat protein